MKLKDIVGLAILALVLIVVGSFIVSNFGRGQEPRKASVEVVLPINPIFNDQSRQILLGQDGSRPAIDFSPPPDLSSGFGNTNPFQP